MKKMLKSRIFLVIVTAVIFTGIGAFASDILASQITYNDTTVEQALNGLYETQANVVNQLKQEKILFITASHKKATGWNDYGFNKDIYVDNTYFTFSSSKITVKKACTVNIKAFLVNAGATTSGSQYKLYKNDSSILSLTNTTSDGDTKTGNVNVTLTAGDILYSQMYGGGNNPTYYITTINLVN